MNRLNNPTWNVRYVAAYLKYWQDKWGATLDISGDPAILATLYNLGDRANAPNTTPQPNQFGEYAANQYNHVAMLLQ